MQVLPVLVASLLGAIALAFVLYPLYHRARLQTSQVESMTTLIPTQTERELVARAALQEVEFDYQLGNLAENDYRSLRTRYLRRAALAMKSRQEREQELDEMIEEQLRKLKEETGEANE
jgi:hypothetical protein